MKRNKFCWKSAAHSVIAVAAVISISVGVVSAINFFVGSEIDLVWTAGGTAIGAWTSAEYDRIRNERYYD